VNKWDIKFSRGWGSGQDRGLNFAPARAGAFKHIYKFSYLKESKSNVYCKHIAIVDMILKRCSYNFLQCKAKIFFKNMK